MMKTLGWAAGAALLASVAATGADAMPLAAVPGVPDQPSVSLVRDGCGPGGFRNRYGECRYGGGGGGGYRGPGFYGAPRFFGGGGDGYRRRCFIREGYYGPRRVCRY